MPVSDATNPEQAAMTAAAPVADIWLHHFHLCVEALKQDRYEEAEYHLKHCEAIDQVAREKLSDHQSM